MLTDERISEMLGKALVAFDTDGIDAVSLTDLAGMAEVSVSDFVRWFASSDEVLQTIVTNEIIEPMTRASAELPGGSASDQLRNYCGRAWEIINTQRFARIYRLMVTGVAQKPALAKFFAEQIGMPIRRQLEAIITKGIAKGEFRSVPAASAARAIAGSLVTQAFWCNHGDLWGSALCGVPSRVVPETVGLMLQGLTRGNPSASLTNTGDPR
jgi:AcrR family transcriptional regulator